MADQLATPEDLASFLERPDLDRSTAVLAIEVSTAVIQAAVDGNRIIRVVDDSETVYGSANQLLRLSQRPVVSIASVTYNGTLLTQGTATTNWAFNPAGVWRAAGWAQCWGAPVATTVVYTHGYAAGDQRLQLARGACLSLAGGLCSTPTGVIREQLDDYAVAYAQADATLAAAPGLRAMLRRQYGPRARMVAVA